MELDRVLLRKRLCFEILIKFMTRMEYLVQERITDLGKIKV